MTTPAEARATKATKAIGNATDRILRWANALRAHAGHHIAAADLEEAVADIKSALSLPPPEAKETGLLARVLKERDELRELQERTDGFVADLSDTLGLLLSASDFNDQETFNEFERQRAASRAILDRVTDAFLANTSASPEANDGAAPSPETGGPDLVPLDVFNEAERTHMAMVRETAATAATATGRTATAVDVLTATLAMRHWYDTHDAKVWTTEQAVEAALNAVLALAAAPAAPSPDLAALEATRRLLALFPARGPEKCGGDS